MTLLLPLLALFLFAGCSTNSHDLVWQNDGPFYQGDGDGGKFGTKTALDRTIQLDPGRGDMRYSPTFLEDPPRTIAVLPFENLEGGNFKLNWVPITSRDGEDEDKWSWTYANRLRKSFFAYMSLREFELLGIPETDAVLMELGLDNAEELYEADPRDLAAALGVEAVIYGKLTDYSAKYLFLYTQVAAGLSVKCVSGKDGSDLFVGSGIRRDSKFRMAFSPVDIIAGAVQNTFNVRKLHLARAADEACRELVASIPIAEKLIMEKESRWRESVVSNETVQAIKEKIAVANGEGTVLLAESGAEEPKAAVGTAGLRPGGESLEGITEGAQLANADGAVRAAESMTIMSLLPDAGLSGEIEESENSEELLVDAGDGFSYIVSEAGQIIDDNPDAEIMEVARSEVIYNSEGGNVANYEGETLEINASDIIYSNTGVVADSPVEEIEDIDPYDMSIEDVMNEIIEMSSTDDDIIYSNNTDLYDGSPS